MCTEDILGATDRLIGHREKSVEFAKIEFASGQWGQGRGGGQGWQRRGWVCRVRSRFKWEPVRYAIHCLPLTNISRHSLCYCYPVSCRCHQKLVAVDYRCLYRPSQTSLLGGHNRSPLSWFDFLTGHWYTGKITYHKTSGGFSGSGSWYSG